MNRRRQQHQIAIPRALRSLEQAVLVARIDDEKRESDFDLRFARRIFKSLGRQWQILDPAVRERVIRAIADVVRDEVNPHLEEIITDPDAYSGEPEGSGSVNGIDHMIGVEDAEFHPAVHRLVSAAFTIERDEQVEPFIRRRIKNCLIALRSHQKSMVAAYRAEGAPL